MQPYFRPLKDAASALSVTTAIIFLDFCESNNQAIRISILRLLILDPRDLPDSAPSFTGKSCCDASLAESLLSRAVGVCHACFSTWAATTARYKEADGIILE
jgi:hypothetical protein